MRFALAYLAFLAVALCCGPAAGQDLLRTGDTRWVVLASARELDKAIGIAETYTWEFDDVRVVESSNGWLAVIAGPISIQSGAKAAKSRLLREKNVRSDIFLSNGASFSRTLWRPMNVSIPQWEYEYGDALRIHRGSLNLIITSRSQDGETHFPVLTIEQSGKVVAQGEIPESATSNGNARLQEVWLDRKSAYPQLVFSSYWLGAHCCTVVKFYTYTDDGWIELSAGALDGDVGFLFRDMDGDGNFEILGKDNSFLYAFAPYAFSWSPTRILRLEGTEVRDLRSDPRYTYLYRRDLYRLEHIAERNPELWSSNGFLAAWVATKAIVGEFDEAWARMLANYDRSDTWPLTKCLVDLTEGSCPRESKVAISFPAALHEHLVKNGYIGTTEYRERWQYRDASPSKITLNRVPAPVEDSGKDRRRPDKPESETRSGTGFFVTDAGDLVTNHHVVEDCSQVTIRKPGKWEHIASVVSRDTINDLALLKMDGDIESSAHIRTHIRLGERVAVFGYPLAPLLSSSGNFTLGNVTALTGIGDDTRYLQISAPVQAGNSGGPLVDERGNVVGVVTAKLNSMATWLASGDFPQNVNFAIRASTLQTFLSAHGVDGKPEEHSEELSAPDLAEKAGSFSVAVVCH